MTTKLLPRGIVLLVVALASYLAEATFYGDIDANGVLQESFFLPLSFILGALGLVALAIGLIARRRA